ncbi:MAG: hypothetical protein AAF065_07665 [Verrucomicrobiota bacterium]
MNFFHLGLIVAVVFWILFHFLYPTMWKQTIGPMSLGTEAPVYPFLDMHGRLAAHEAWSTGFDVIYNPNPLDPLGRQSVKPSWGLKISSLGMFRDQLAVASSIAIFGALICMLSVLRVRSIGEGIYAFLLIASPALMLSFERANDDLVYFSFLGLIPLLLRDSEKPKAYLFWLCWFVIFMLAPAKYYPGAAFAIFLVSPPKPGLFWQLFFAGLIFVGVVLGFYWNEINYLRSAVPSPSFFMVNGLPVWLRHLELPGFVRVMASALIAFMVLAGVSTMWRQVLFEKISISSKRCYVLGLSIYLFCYLLNSNYDYRFVFLIFLIPALFELTQAMKDRHQWKRMLYTLLICLCVLLWVDVLGYHFVKNWVSEPLQVPVVEQVTLFKNLTLFFLILPLSWIFGCFIGPGIFYVFGLERFRELPSKN